ncbi:MAG: hypothetical protein US49_C0005G0038 [candidate division TM6 bacterium GW2011_GWF2_37_49]|nr:MAG: hypothetical protein US49_C0005G0038 [candidate division TM6 bacterium GW2011_GWF2_37_49]
MKKFYGMILAGLVLASPLMGMEEQVQSYRQLWGDLFKTTDIHLLNPGYVNSIKNPGYVNSIKKQIVNNIKKQNVIDGGLFKYSEQDDKFEIYNYREPGETSKEMNNHSSCGACRGIIFAMRFHKFINLQAPIGAVGLAALLGAYALHKKNHNNVALIPGFIALGIGGVLLYDLFDDSSLEDRLYNYLELKKKPVFTFDSEGLSVRGKLIAKWTDIYAIKMRDTQHEYSCLGEGGNELFRMDYQNLWIDNKRHGSRIGCDELESLFAYYLTKYGNETIKAKLA